MHEHPDTAHMTTEDEVEAGVIQLLAEAYRARECMERAVRGAEALAVRHERQDLRNRVHVAWCELRAPGDDFVTIQGG